jgi:tRNA(adenine34) deaminase
MNTDSKFMKEAIKEAKKSYYKNEVPIGAVIVKNNKIISRAHNQIESCNDATAHAEILAIKKAGKKLKNWRLLDCDVYVTLEPCPMCKSALLQARVRKVIFGCRRIKSIGEKRVKKSITIKGHVLEKECKDILQKFFQNIRKNRK